MRARTLILRSAITGGAIIIAGALACHFKGFNIQNAPTPTGETGKIPPLPSGSIITSSPPSLDVAATPVFDRPKTRLETAEHALRSQDPTIVYKQFLIVRNCFGVAQRQDDLMLIKSGVFPENNTAKSEAEKSQLIAATTQILASCEDFLKLGRAPLQQLAKKLQKHGEDLGSLLFINPQNKEEERALAAFLITSKSPDLIESGVNEMVRGLIDESEDAQGHKDAELWDRAIFIAGCKLGDYCGKDSIRSAMMCWKSQICDLGVEAFWLSELDSPQVSLVKARSDRLAKWLAATPASRISTVNNYANLSRALAE